MCNLFTLCLVLYFKNQSETRAIANEQQV